jgi:uncharacterized protein YbjT (DUF2867 family)
MDKGILLFGATARTGLDVARILRERGEPVTAAVRESSDRTGLEALGASLVVADGLDADAVNRAFASGKFRAVISTIGGSRKDPRRPDFESTRNIVDAAKRHGVKRVLLVTAIGSGDSRDALAPTAWKYLGPVIELKTQAEDYLMASGLDATILRPGGMRSEAATGTAVKTEDHTVMGTINRADLAALVVECLDDDTTIGRIYHTIDPAIDELPPLQRGDTAHFEGKKP